MKALIVLLSVAVVLAAFAAAFYVYRSRSISSSNIVVNGYNRPCSSCVYVNLSVYIDGLNIVFKGYFDEQLMNNSLRTLVDKLVDLKQRNQLEVVKHLATTWSMGPGYGPLNITYSYTCINSTCSITSVEYNVDLSWKLFTFKGGWCLYAVSRALYLLDLIDYTKPKLIIMLKSPLHAILLLKERVGPEAEIDGYGLWYVYINYPSQQLDLSSDNILYTRIY